MKSKSDKIRYGLLLSIGNLNKTAFVFSVGIMAGLLSQPASAALIGLYQFEDASGAVGATIADSSGNAFHGEVKENPITFVSHAGHGNAGSFGPEGSEGRVISTIAGAENLDDFATAFWFRTDTEDSLNSSNKYIVTRSEDTAPRRQLAVLYSWSFRDVELFESEWPSLTTRTGSQMGHGDLDWHHFVYTRTGTDYDSYLDGVKTDIGTLTGQLTGVSNTFKINGQEANGNKKAFDVSFDDVAHWNEGLNQVQVNAIMGGDFSAWAIPEPTSLVMALLGTSIGLLGVAGRRREADPI